MNQSANNINKSVKSFNTRFAFAALFSIAVCILIGFAMRMLFDTDTFVPIIVVPIVLLSANYKKMKNNYLAKKEHHD